MQRIKPGGCRLSYTSNKSSDLEPHHTHYIFVDGHAHKDRLIEKELKFLKNQKVNVKSGLFDKEIDMLTSKMEIRQRVDACEEIRSCFESYFHDTLAENIYQRMLESKHKHTESQQDPEYVGHMIRDSFFDFSFHVGSVHLLIGGSGNDHLPLKVSERAIRDAAAVSPVVILDGSGGIADVLAYAWRLLHDTSARAFNLSRSELDAKVRKVFNLKARGESAKVMTRLLEIVSVKSKLVVFDTKTAAIDDLDAAMLHGLLQNMQPQTPRSYLRIVKDDPSDEKSGISRELSQYMLHLDYLRFAVGFDRLVEIEEHYNAAEKVWKLLGEHVGKHFEDDSDKDKLILKATGFEPGIDPTFSEHIHMALEWALLNNRVNQAKFFVDKIGNIAKFVYGPFAFHETNYAGAIEMENFSTDDLERYGRNPGATLARLHNYEENQSRRQYLDPLYNTKGKTCNQSDYFCGCCRFCRQELTKRAGSNGKTWWDFDSIRMRKVWSLVLQLLLNDEDATAKIDESQNWFKFNVPRKNFQEATVGTRKYPEHWVNPTSTKSDGESNSKSDEQGDPVIDCRVDRTLQSVWVMIQEKGKADEEADVTSAALLANQEMMIWAVLMQYVF